MKFGTWVLTPDKYMERPEADRLLAVARDRAQHASRKHAKVAIRDYFVIHLTLVSGLRVMEIAALRCGDLVMKHQIGSIFVRHGKGNKQRVVFFPASFQNHYESYLKWKQQMGESIETESPLIVSSMTGSFMTRRALQKMFKRCAKRAGLPENYSIHCLRHTYACFLYKASDWNLRLVQKQLGHARISTTQVYADVMMPDIGHALNRLPSH